MTNYLRGLNTKAIRKLQAIGRDYLRSIPFSISQTYVEEIKY